MNPKVFVSHASEDKERFVINFATKLRANGIDAWLDKWEMLPGDSLVDKIFEEGLKEADAVIIILSNFSVNKPWVREELNTSIVNRIGKGTKIIPVVLDACDVPEALTSTLWEQISDTKSYDSNFKRILSSILGTNEKPALGKLPAYTSSAYQEISELAKVDNLILKEAGDYILKKNDGYHIEPDKVFGTESDLAFSTDEIKDSIEILENHGYFHVTWLMGCNDSSYSCHIEVTTNGFDTYAHAYIQDYSELVEKIISAIVNEKIHDNNSLISKIGTPKVLINHVLLALESNGHIKIGQYMDGGIDIHHVSVSLKRMLA